MATYRKKPVEVEAWQLLDTNASIAAMTRRLNGTVHHGYTGIFINFPIAKNDGHPGVISVGDWAIAEPDGTGFYPCTNEQFAATYEELTP